MRTITQRLVCALMIPFATVANADTITFESIPNASGANDMSPDGRYIVGQTLAFQAYVYDSLLDQMLILPAEATSATAVSDDGSVVLGDIIDPKTGDETAAIWTSESGVWTSLGYLPGGLPCPSRSNGYELSADGSVAVGLSWVDGCDARGFRWTQATGMVELEGMANGGNRASVVSADGSVIGGFAQGSFSRTPAIWDGIGNGLLLDPPAGDALGEVFGLKDDGSILLGEWNGDAVTWTGPSHVRTVLGSGSILPGWNGIAMDIADDGTTVGFDILVGNRRAWIQPAGTGPLIDFKTYIEANGASVPTGTILEVCQAISADGRKIIGHGFGSGAWIVKIEHETICLADIAPASGNGVVDIDDLFVVIGEWGSSGGAADIAPPGGNGMVDIDDLFEVIAGWGSCPGAVGACCLGESCVQITEADCLNAGGTYQGNSVPCSPITCQPNDACADAINITANINGAVVLGDNGTATPPTFGGPDPELPIGSPSCHWFENPGAAHSSVWYSFIAPESGSVTIATCGSAFPFNDSNIGLYSGVCGGLVEVGCDEDGCMDTYYSQLFAMGLNPGEIYYICVMNSGDWGGSVPGPFELTITSP